MRSPGWLADYVWAISGGQPTRANLTWIIYRLPFVIGLQLYHCSVFSRATRHWTVIPGTEDTAHDTTPVVDQSNVLRAALAEMEEDE